MIEATNLTKRFEDFTALDGVSCRVEQGSIYGMVGSNGAGKSTFLRVLAGIYQRDGGELFVDGEDIWENPSAKKKMFLVPDELYFLPGATIPRMAALYRSIYPDFDDALFQELLRAFQLPELKAVDSFSKGMKRQAAAILALSVRSDYLLFDETFDGLDPVMRKYVKSLICSDVADRHTTVVVTSHSLRELEDLCDQLVLLHRGGIVLESDASYLRSALFKVQIALPGEFNRHSFDDIPGILKYEKSGSVASMILRGDSEMTARKLRAKQPLILDILPLSLEEVFLYEMQHLGYRFEDVLGSEDSPDSKIPPERRWKTDAR